MIKSTTYQDECVVKTINFSPMNVLLVVVLVSVVVNLPPPGLVVFVVVVTSVFSSTPLSSCFVVFSSCTSVRVLPSSSQWSVTFVTRETHQTSYYTDVNGQDISLLSLILRRKPLFYSNETSPAKRLQ